MSQLSAAAIHLMSQATHDNAVASLLWVSRRDFPAQLSIQPARMIAPEQLLKQPWQQRHDLALLYLDADLAPDDARHLLSSVRDLHAKKLVAFLPTKAWGWDDTALLALGLQQQARFQQPGAANEAGLLYEAWSFDILAYKPSPDWLNPRFWANPENWNKFRW